MFITPGIDSNVWAWAIVKSAAFAVEPVLLPLIVFAAICAAFAFVTAFAAIVAAFEPEVVTSPDSSAAVMADALPRTMPVKVEPVPVPEPGVLLLVLVPGSGRGGGGAVRCAANRCGGS